MKDARNDNEMKAKDKRGKWNETIRINQGHFVCLAQRHCEAQFVIFHLMFFHSFLYGWLSEAIQSFSSFLHSWPRDIKQWDKERETESFLFIQLTIRILVNVIVRRLSYLLRPHLTHAYSFYHCYERILYVFAWAASVGKVQSMIKSPFDRRTCLIEWQNWLSFLSLRTILCFVINVKLRTPANNSKKNISQKEWNNDCPHQQKKIWYLMFSHFCLNSFVDYGSRRWLSCMAFREKLKRCSKEGGSLVDFPSLCWYRPDFSTFFWLFDDSSFSTDCGNDDGNL